MLLMSRSSSYRCRSVVLKTRFAGCSPAGSLSEHARSAVERRLLAILARQSAARCSFFVVVELGDLASRR